jgi:hypothetical protein
MIRVLGGGKSSLPNRAGLLAAVSITDWNSSTGKQVNDDRGKLTSVYPKIKL